MKVQRRIKVTLEDSDVRHAILWHAQRMIGSATKLVEATVALTVDEDGMVEATVEAEGRAG